MENKKRVLAYQLAVPLSNDVLDDVSGGSNMTSKQTIHVSGSSSQSADAVWEMVVDF